MSKLESVLLGSGLVGQKNRSREDLRKDILVGFGHPIIKVELTNEHLDNAINSALRIWARNSQTCCCEVNNIT